MTVEWLVKYTASYVALSFMFAWLKRKADGKSADSYLYGVARSAGIAACGACGSAVSWHSASTDARWILGFLVCTAIFCWYGMEALADVSTYRVLRGMEK